MLAKSTEGRTRVHIYLILQAGRAKFRHKKNFLAVRELRLSKWNHGKR